MPRLLEPNAFEAVERWLCVGGRSLKRAFPQESFSDLVPASLEDVVERVEQGFSGNRRRVRTSAAMLGLALSMGASGALLSRQGAVAAAGLPSAPLNPTLSTLPSGLDVPAAGMMPVATLDASDTVYHTVQEGQTLSQIANVHSVEVNTVEQANGVSAETVLQVGQVLKIPVSVEAEPVPTSSDLPSELAVAQQEQAAFDQSDAQLKASQAAALEAVHQKRQELQQALELSIRPEQFSVEASDQAQPATSSGVEPQFLGRVAPSQVAAALDENEPTPQLLQDGREADSLSAATWTSEAVPVQIEAERVESQVFNASPEPKPELTVNPEVEIGLPTAADDQGEVEAEVVQEETLQISTSIEGVSSPPWIEQPYDIREGDTIADLAEAYGISTADLVRINQLENPDLIVAGESLLIPQVNQQSGSLGSAGVETVAAVDGPVFSSGANANSPLERLTQLQSTVLNPIENEADLQQLRQTMLPTRYSRALAPDADQPAVADPASADIAIDNPSADTYMANLMADVDAAQQLAISELQSSEQSVASIAAVEAPENLSEMSSAAVNPEFENRASYQSAASDSALGGPVPVVDDSTQLLAAAPLGSEAYAPINRPAAGQVVSPDMPALPNADEFLPEAPNYFNGYVWPTTGTLTSGYGRRWGRMHHGVDIAGPVGTPIVAAASGVIERAGWNSGGYGNLIDIRHADGSMTRYAHNSRLLVSSGQQVAQGQQIAEMGSTGYSTGPHLHFEVHLQGQGTVNPISYLPGR